MNWTERLKEEFLSGWKPFEVAWVVIFLAAQIIAYVLMPDSPLGMISGIAGILCVVFVSKGKISNYFFGLIFAYTYFYVSWGSNFLGEMNLHSFGTCLLYTSPSPRDRQKSRMPSSA